GQLGARLRPVQTCVLPLYSVFFFSSRRRHTRSYGDWSSDVCSSDLQRQKLSVIGSKVSRTARPITQLPDHSRLDSTSSANAARRSEERRVGKECRSRWSRWQKRKKTPIT